jgi:hypothetical protein
MPDVKSDREAAREDGSDVGQHALITRHSSARQPHSDV